MAVWLIARGFTPQAAPSVPEIATAPDIEPSMAGAL